MVLSGGKKISSIKSITSLNQGGGNKKAGFSYQIGRGWRSQIALRNCHTQSLRGTGVFSSVKCCTLKDLQKTYVFPNISRNIGRNNATAYWNGPGV